jgi:type IV pilus assembly protein PilM
MFNLDIFKPKAPPLFGMDISSSSVKMVELMDAGKGAIRVERYAIEALPRDAVVDGNIANLEAVVQSVSQGWRKLSTRTRNVAMALPTAAVITKVIIVPAGLREEELELQVESEANQYIPFALEEVNLDFQVIGPAPSSPEEVQVLIAASRKEKVVDRVAVAEGAGLKSLVMDVENYAVQASFELIKKQFPEEGKDQNVALVDVGANVMNVVVLRNDQTVYTREQVFGGSQLTQDIMKQYGMSQEEAEAAKRSGGLPDNYEAEVLRPFIENVALEVQRALQFFFTSTPYTSVEHILLTGGSAIISGLEGRGVHPDAGQHGGRQPVCGHGGQPAHPLEAAGGRRALAHGRLRACTEEVRPVMSVPGYAQSVARVK